MSHPINDIYFESQREAAEEQGYTSTLAYRVELHKAWLSLIEKYPHLYSFQDYAEACKKVGLLLF